MKLLLTVCLALSFYACGKKQIPPPRPTPQPTAAPTPQPTVAPSPLPTPETHPTPEVDLTPYLHQQAGRVMTVVETEGDLGAAINSIDTMLGAEPGTIVVRGGGAIKTQVVVSHDLEFETGTYALDVPTLEGQILTKSNVKVEGRGAILLEPTWIDPDSGMPAITVLQNYDGAKRNEAASSLITIRGIKVIGRQTKTDGGVRQTISLGNTDRYAVINCMLVNVASIGIQAGGSAADGHHALNGVITGNTVIGAAAAHIALVNVSGAHVYNNTIVKPGWVGGPGGVSGVDIETNNSDDWAENIKIYNNTFDYTEAAFNGVGSAILAQQRGSSRTGGLLIVNNRMYGSLPTNGMSSGIFFTGAFPGGIVANNFIQRSGQPGIQLYGAESTTFQDNVMVNVGGGGLPAIYMIGSTKNTFRRNTIMYIESVGGSYSHAIVEVESPGNVYENNRMLQAH